MQLEDEALLAEALLKKGWLDGEKFQQAIAAFAATRAAEPDVALLEVLARNGFLTDLDVRELRAEIDLEKLARPDACHAIAGYCIWSTLELWGAGTVFKALQLSMERPVALKVLAPARAKDPRFLERFLQEGRAAGQANHPHVVGALDLGRSGDYYYCALELAEGTTVREALRGGPLPLPAALELARQMALALAHIDALGLTHRDVHPGNIVLTPQGPARLRNLGVARLPGDPSVADTGIPIGAPRYASPELARGSHDVDIRGDIYSLGATLYHAVTGQAPIQAGTGVLPPPEVARPGVPRGVSALITRMMAPEASGRFANAAELLHAIGEVPREVEHKLPVAAAAPPAPSSAAALEIAPPAVPPPPPPGAAVAVGGQGAAPGAEVPLNVLPSEGQLRRERAVTRFAWAAVLAVVGGVALLMGIWAVRSHFVRQGVRQPHETRPREQASPRKNGDKQAAPPAAKEPRPEPPRTPRRAPSEAAMRLAEAALAFDQENPEEHAEVLLRLRRALLVVEGTPLATKLRARLATRQQMLSGAANAAYNELNDRLALLRAQGQFGEVLRGWAGFPTAFRHGPWAEMVAARLAECAEEAERRYLTLATNGAAALQKQSLSVGVSSYKAIATIGIPWIARAAEPLIAAAAEYARDEEARLKDAAERDTAIERRRGLGRLTRSFTLVHAEIRKRDYAKARELCSAIPEKLRDDERGKAVERLEARIGVLAALWDAIQAGPRAAMGKKLVLHGTEWAIEGFAGSGANTVVVLGTRAAGGDRTLRQLVLRLPSQQFCMLGEWALDGRPAATVALSVAILCLGEGEAALARQKLQQAAKLGADAQPYLDELDAEALVALALRAQREGRWAEARKLVETAFDRYGLASAVILNQPALVNALQDSLSRLGEPSAAQQTRAAPLPDALRSLVLLPETRLGPVPPASPLDEQFASPLQRGGSVRAGLDTWRDYEVSASWASPKAAPLVLGVRVSEPRRGQFQYYYVAVDAAQVTLGRHDANGDKVLATRPVAGAPGAQKRQLVVGLSGHTLSVELDGGGPVEATDSTLSAGSVVLLAPLAPVHIHEVRVSFPPPGPRGPGRKGP